ncbi:glycosyltransferase [Chryseobacterium sp. GMJ5]|uniref:Glycosyltransferase n=1 Tax=Chryseobacterium gilvum TaxID=2976534 RepID=A0ABT2VYL1_9FLAO|nr:glycosyltransferase [Chryseobacterium gilvum]MCU7614714.1 glycosyltransferase [Chryseobacterium gilvum]
MSKILFLTTAHNYNDDRILYHQAKELKSRGSEVKICSLYSDFQGNIEGIDVEAYSILEKSSTDKIQTFLKVCEDFQPDCIICSEPIPVLAARKFGKSKKVSIIYDITEWYPAMSMLEGYSFLLKGIHFFKFFLIQLYAGLLSTHFIFGEETKKFPLAYIFPFKKRMTLPYYPDQSYISESINSLKNNEITLCYTGAISKDKGIGNFFNAIAKLQKRKPGLKVSILIVGSARKESDEHYFSQLLSTFSFDHITLKKPAIFEKFAETFAEADICFDLRALNFENHHSLPIKLFYYIGAGKPIIYSNLKGIRQHMDVSGFGYLVDPENSDLIADVIIQYTENPELYYKHAQNARNEFTQKYNWDTIKNSFADFVDQSIDKTRSCN